MKKFLFDDRPEIASARRTDKRNAFQITDSLLFITKLEDLSIVGTNLKSKYFMNPPSGTSRLEPKEYYKDILSPDNYPRFISLLESCRQLKDNEEITGTFRIKTPQGNWQDFDFTHRLYHGNFPPSIITIASERPEATPLEKAATDNGNGYQMLLNSLDEGYCRIDIIFDMNGVPRDYLFLETNPAFESHILLSNVEGKTVQELVPNYDERWSQIYGEVATTGIPNRFQDLSENLGKNWFNIYAFPIGSSDHPQVAILFSNITANKKSEKDLQQLNMGLENKVAQRTRELNENSELLQTVFDNSSQGIAVYQPLYENEELVDFRYLRVNTLIKRIFKNTELVGRRFSDFNKNEMDLGIFEALKSTMLSGRKSDFEVHYKFKGYDNWFRIIARRKNGLLIGSVEDITRKKQESQRLKENVRFKKHLTGASPDIIMIFNLYDENIRYINRDMGPMIGMKRKDILNKNLMEVVPFIHPRDRERALEFHTKILQASDKDVLEMEFQLRSDKGKYKWFKALGKVFMRNKYAKVYEYMIVLRNIDEHIATQKALSNAEKLSIKGEIARTFAHELRNPLASIGMASDILKSKFPEGDEKTMNMLSIIKRSTTVLNDLVTEMLTSSNYSPSILKESCLAQILDDTLKMAQDRIYLSGIKVVKNYKGTYTINADEEKLRIALLNLIVNASEAMVPDEGILEFSIEKVEDDFTLSIADNGCGLEKEQLEKLFDAFYTQKPNGIGVGLSSVKNILEEHNAKIEVHSEPNKGTIFNLTFHCL